MCLLVEGYESATVQVQALLVASDLAYLQDTVNFPVHLKNFNMGQLRQLCKELRSDIVHTVSKTGGALIHLVNEACMLGICLNQ